ncbi:hypothetical protein BDM02DRAFT_3261612 [Thelephora ganbajun]|uniref:Uncharacterized protein n=1 Tax=Thelephora ganbajun TaxID=370292 RepID=A0ACB6ZDB2_THEGA|nr:hypothetical protein BDM02DRAFT_3261612 [Thelephora ganbajun]
MVSMRLLSDLASIHGFWPHDSHSDSGRSYYRRLPLLSLVFCGQSEKTFSALKRNRNEIALGYLRARKQLEGIPVKRSKALGNLESALWTVEHAAGGVEVASSQTDSLNIRVPSLQRDEIDETIDDALHSATEDAKDVDPTIRLPSKAEQAMVIDAM